MKLTPESLDAALKKGDEKACLVLFDGATEKERQAVADVAARRFKEVSGEMFIETKPGTFERNPELTAAAIAVYAACSLSQLKKFGWRAILDRETAYRVLSKRRPAWIDDWVTFAIETNPRHFPLVRRLMREGLCRRPEHDNYLLGMLDIHSSDLGRFTSVRAGLLADPELLVEVWRLFEIEGNGEFSLAARDKFTHKPEGTWEHALVTLADEDKLSRNRLLDVSLDALGRGFAQFRAGWFSRFHEALQPTLEERASRAQSYLHLLGSQIPPTVSFALKALAILDKAGRLPPRTVVESVSPALAARQKGTVQAALKLLDKAAKAEPDLQTVIAALAAEALKHESADVQGATLDLIERYGSSSNKELVVILSEHAAGLAASQRPRLHAWLKKREGKPTEARPKESPKVFEGLLERASKLERRLRKLAGIDEAVAAVRGEGDSFPALEIEVMAIPHLDRDQVISPIQNLEELIDRFAAVLEDAGSPDEVECVLDGVSRLCGERPDDFDRRTGPLQKRARTLLKKSWSGPFVGGGPQPDLCGVAIAWTTGLVPETPKDQVVRERARTVLDFLSQRALAVARRTCTWQASPLLAAPTHRGGWIDPRVLVERVLDRQAVPAKADPFDEVQSLLRLAPDHRTAALRKAAKLDGEYGATLQYALGDTTKIGPTAALWIAAARARAPFSADPLVEKKHPGLGPDAGITAQYSYGVKPEKQWRHFLLKREPAIPKSVELELATVLLHAGTVEKSYAIAIEHLNVSAIRWASTVWPLGREAWFAAGAGLLGRNLDWWEADWGNRIYLEPLLDADVPLMPMALLLLVLGLAAKEPGESGLATDALIASIEDGRLDGRKLGTAFASWLGTGLVKASRWAKTLESAARTTSLHAAVVREAIQHTLQGDPAKAPKDLLTLLELLKELLMESGCGVSHAEARGYLSALKATGKTGKLARELLALDDHPDQSYRQSTALQALVGRLNRAERWQRCL